MGAERNSRRSSWLRAIRRLLLAVATVVLFVLALAVGVLLHLDVAASRRVAARALNALFAQLLRGRIEIVAFDDLRPDRAVISTVHIVDLQGATVLSAQRLVVRAAWWNELMPWLLGLRDARLVIEQTQIERVELSLAATADGQLSLAEALSPRERPPPPPPDPTESPAPPKLLVIEWPSIEIGQLTVQGVVPGGQRIDGELRRVHGGLQVGTDGSLLVDVLRAGVRERALLGREIAGSVAYHLRALPVRMWGDFAGDVGGLEVVVAGKLVDGRIDAVADLPRVAPGALEAWLPGLPVRHPFVGRLAIAGVPPRLEVGAKLAFPRLPNGLGRGSVVAGGLLTLESPAALDLNVRVDNVDSRMFADEPVWATVGGAAELHVRLEGEDSELRVMFEGQGPTSLGEPLPRTGGTILVDRGQVATWLRLVEPGTPADVFAQYDTSGVVRTAVELDVARLDGRTRLGDRLASLLGHGALSGRGHVRARARWAEDRLDADFGVALRSFGWPEAGVTLGSVDLDGRLAGPLDALELDARAGGHGLAVAGRVLQRFDVVARGPILEPTVHLTATDDDRREIQAQAIVSPQTGAARQVRLSMGRDGAAIDARVASVRTTSAGLAVEGFELDGLGRAGLRGRLSVRNGELGGTLRGSGLELEPLRKLLGIPFPVRGTADVDVDLSGQGRERQGHVRLAVHDAGILVVDGIQAGLDAEIDGAQLRADARVALVAPGDAVADGAAEPADPCAGTFAAIEVVGAQGLLDGPLLSRDTYEHATGTVPVRMPRLRLACIGQTLAQVFYSGQTAPLAELDGLLDVAFDVAREKGVRWPSIRGLRVSTQGLKVVANPAEPADAGEPAVSPWASDQLDVELSGSFEARTSETYVGLVVRDRAKLAELAVSTHLPVDALAVGDLAAAWDEFLHEPTLLRLEVPRRSLRSLTSLPAPLRTRVPEAAGEVELLASVIGSLADPTATVRVRGWGLGLPAATSPTGTASPLWKLPLDIDSVATYARSSTGIEVGFSGRGREFARLSAGLQADLPKSLWSGKWPPEDSTGTLGLHFDSLPLGAVGALSSRSVDGTLSGDVTLTNLGQTPRLQADLRASALRFGGSSTIESARLSIRPASDFGAGTIVLDTELRAAGAGRLTATAYGGLLWKEGLWPSIDRDAPADLLVRAEAMPLQAFHPLLTPAVSKLEGRLDGDMRLQWQQVAASSDADLNVDMRLVDGVVHVPEIGQELRGLRAHVTAAPGGIVRVDDIEALATSGRMSGACRVRLDGFDIRDLMGEFTVAEGEEVPVTFEGVPLGTGSGRVIVHAVKHPDEVELNITGEKLRLALPASASQSVQPLRDNPDVSVSHLLEQPRSGRGKEALRWNITLGLLDSEVRGSGVRLLLSSNPQLPPTITVGDDTRFGGELVLQSGEFDFLGLGSGLQPFVLDRGLVRFRTEDPSNPYVNVAAHYDVPDGSTITVEYAGLLKPISRDKIRFRSSPPRTEQEIIALLLFGDAGASSATSGADTTGGDSGTTGGGSIAAYQLNALLGGITPLRGLSTTFGVTDEGYTSTGVSYQISDTVSAQAAYERRDQASNAGTVDTTSAGRGADSLSRTRVGVDWRFYEDFLLRGSVGIGDEPTTGLDLMWQYRY